MGEETEVIQKNDEKDKTIDNLNNGVAEIILEDKEKEEEIEDKKENTEKEEEIEDKKENTEKEEIEIEEQRCPHLHQANPDKFKAKIFLDAKCMQCVGPMKQAKKGYENRKGQKGGGKKNNNKKSAPEDSGIWICAGCANIGCGRDSPYKHALTHAQSGKHHLAVQWEPRTLMVWCYECDDEVFPDDSVQYKNIRNVLTILRGGIPEPSQSALRKEQDAISRKEKRKQDRLLQQADKKNNKQKQKQDYNNFEITTPYGDTSSSTSFKGVKGLANLGNTCFFNSVLQNISHTRILLDYYLGKEKNDLRDVQGNMNLAMQETVKLIWTEGKGGKLSPNSLFSSIASKFTMFKRKQQQDAHELLCCLLDGLSSEGKASFVKDIFGGRLISTVTCHECQTPSRTWEPFFIVSLPIPLEASQIKPHSQAHTITYEPPARGNAKLSAAKLRRLQEREAKRQSKAQAEAEAEAEDDKDVDPVSVPLPDSPSLSSSPSPSPSLSSNNEATEDTSNNGAEKKDETAEETTKEESKEETKETAKETQDETKDETKEETNEEIKEVKEETKEETKEAETKEEVKEENTTKVVRKQKEAKDSNSEVKGKKLTPGPVELRQWNGEPIKPNKGALSIMDCMLAFTDPEVLEGKNAFGCSACTKLRDGDKKNEGEPVESDEEIEIEAEDNETKEDNKDSVEDAKEDGKEETQSQDAPTYSDTKENEKKEKEVGNGKKKEDIKKKDKKEIEDKTKKTKTMVTCTATKQLLLDSPPPPVLVLHLKRFMQFKNSLQKISKSVSFPPSLNLTSFFVPPSSSSSSTSSNNSFEYKLAGVVEHSGSMAGGHYVAYFHNDADDLWYYASDTHVSVSSLEHALKSEAYLLFYHKVN